MGVERDREARGDDRGMTALRGEMRCEVEARGRAERVVRSDCMVRFKSRIESGDLAHLFRSESRLVSGLFVLALVSREGQQVGVSSIHSK